MIFFPENFVCLPFSFAPLGPNAFEKRPIESAETGQNANLMRGRAFER